MLEKPPLGPIYDLAPGSSYWRAVDSVGSTSVQSYAEPQTQMSGRDMARMRQGPDAATVLRGLPLALRGDVRVEPSDPSFCMAPPEEVSSGPLSAAQAMLRMVQGPARPPGMAERG